MNKRFVLFFLLVFLVVHFGVNSSANPAGVIVKNGVEHFMGSVVRWAYPSLVDEARLYFAEENDSWLGTLYSGPGGLLFKALESLSLGVRDYSGKVIEEYILPVTTAKPVPPPVFPDEYASYNTRVNLYNWAGKVEFYNGKDFNRFCVVTEYSSTDGLRHELEYGIYDSLSDFINQCNAVYSFYKPCYLDESVIDDSCPNGHNVIASLYFLNDGQSGFIIQVAKDGRTYYFLHPYVFQNADYGNGHIESVDPPLTVALVRPVVTEPEDGIKRFMYKDGGFVADKDDPDWSKEELSQLSSPSNLIFNGTVSGGRNSRVDVGIVDGDVRLQSVTDTGRENVVNFRQMTFNRDGSPGQVVEEGRSGTSIDNFYEFAPHLSMSVTNNSVGGENVTINLPTDYARVGEAASAAETVNKGTKEQVDRLLDMSGASINDPAVPDSSFMDTSFFSGVFDSLLSWRIPPHLSVCPVMDISIDLYGYENRLYMDSHCLIAEDNRNLFSVIMVAVWFIVALFIVLRA
ncbi:MAG: hypothetical protein FWF12_04055 [Betaproteobacteria bacterium]|nr:hypothetical protein [Betaproteobacteria bacterium]